MWLHRLLIGYCRLSVFRHFRNQTVPPRNCQFFLVKPQLSSPSSLFRQVLRASNKNMKTFKPKSQRTTRKCHVSLTKSKPSPSASRINTKPLNARSRRRQKLMQISSRLQPSIQRKKPLQKCALDKDNNTTSSVKNEQSMKSR